MKFTKQSMQAIKQEGLTQFENFLEYTYDKEAILDTLEFFEQFSAKHQLNKVNMQDLTVILDTFNSRPDFGHKVATEMLRLMTTDITVFN